MPEPHDVVDNDLDVSFTISVVYLKGRFENFNYINKISLKYVDILRVGENFHNTV